MKTKFLTFGGNAHGRGKRFRTAAVRITGQARNSGLFDEIKLYTDLSLPHEFPTFWSQHGKFIEANNRGYGYWLWKPFLILEAIKPMREGDVLLYADAGCELNLSARERLRCYICDPAPDRLLLGTAGIIKNWIKMDAIQRVGLDANQLDLRIHEASVIIMTKSPLLSHLIEDWYSLCYESNYHFLDDSISRVSNHPDFQEHRHDQALLTLLIYKHQISPRFIDTSINTCNPIWTARNLTGLPHPELLGISHRRRSKGIFSQQYLRTVLWRTLRAVYAVLWRMLRVIYAMQWRIQQRIDSLRKRITW